MLIARWVRRSNAGEGLLGDLELLAGTSRTAAGLWSAETVRTAGANAFAVWFRFTANNPLAEEYTSSRP
jgi:hypothetical protein